MPALMHRPRPKHSAYSVFRTSSLARELIGEVPTQDHRYPLGESNRLASQAFDKLSATDKKFFEEEAARMNEKQQREDLQRFLPAEEVERRR